MSNEIGERLNNVGIGKGKVKRVYGIEVEEEACVLD